MYKILKKKFTFKKLSLHKMKSKIALVMLYNCTDIHQKKKGFFTVKEDPYMLIPVMLLTALAVGLGIWPNPLIEYISGIVAGIL